VYRSRIPHRRTGARGRRRNRSCRSLGCCCWYRCMRRRRTSGPADSRRAPSGRRGRCRRCFRTRRSLRCRSVRRRRSRRRTRSRSDSRRPRRHRAWGSPRRCARDPRRNSSGWGWSKHRCTRRERATSPARRRARAPRGRRARGRGIADGNGRRCPGSCLGVRIRQVSWSASPSPSFPFFSPPRRRPICPAAIATPGEGPKETHGDADRDRQHGRGARPE